MYFYSPEQLSRIRRLMLILSPSGFEVLWAPLLKYFYMKSLNYCLHEKIIFATKVYFYVQALVFDAHSCQTMTSYCLTVLKSLPHVKLHLYQFSKLITSQVQLKCFSSH